MVRQDGLEDRIFRELPELLRAGDVLVFNNTRVIPAALSGNRIGRGGTTPKIEALLHMRLDGHRWKAFVKPAKKLEAGDRLRFGAEGRVCLLGTLDATVEAKGEAGEVTLAFDFHGPALDEAIAAVGEMPLPPYIAGKRGTDEQDRADYQTIYAEKEGAVAAPTAGLHFTPELLARLEDAGISQEFVTLHVGAGTFLPVKADDTKDHKMHAEWGEVTAATCAAPQGRPRQGRAHRGGRHDLASPARSLGPRAVLGHDGDLHHPGLPLPRRWTCSSPTSTCRNRRCSCWSRPLPGWSACARPMPMPSPMIIASIPMATPACYSPRHDN